ncbi:hypothetical protein N2384_01310 [Bacillus paralicheniformis]|uniref:hypothetical protein n=1 Tax=Bacillus paralicheniformis TaxID=1648923 RepID=UPI0021A8356F|nr:hypothetical protein [Bacillus paralicheniformis]UWS61925.1 hypothetical protein N2384_01310 [Bacillus paralicheniformis]
MLHLKISNAILDFDPPQTLVILSGDGKGSDFGTSFPIQVKRALRHGWNVEIYSTSMSFGKKYYKALKEEYNEKIQLIELDDYYEHLTFVKAGDYYTRDEEGNKVYYRVEGRVVKPL